MKLLPDIVVHAEAYKDDTSVPLTLFFNYPSSDFEAIECGVLFDKEDDFEKVYTEIPNYPISLSIRSKTAYEELWIPRMRLVYSYREFPDQTHRGIAELLIKGQLDDFKSSKGSLECHVLLQDGPLINSQINDLSVSWLTPFGEARLTYDYLYDGQVRDMKGRSPVNKPMIYISLDPTQHKSLYDLSISLSAYLDDFMWFVSFLSKKYIHWYRFEMLYKPEDQEADYFRFITAHRDPSIVQRNPTLTKFENHPSILLIKPEKLQADVAYRLFGNYNQSPHKETIKKLIIAIMMTFTNPILEQDLGIIYAALEELVHVMDKEHKRILENQQFQLLKKSIEHFLDSEIQTKGVELNSEQLEAIKQKVNELNRYSYKIRLASVFDNILKIIADSLPERLTPQILLETLKGVVNRRNHYTHQNKIEDPGVAEGDVALIRFLLSLWILKELGYPIEHFSQYDPDLAMVEWAIYEAKNNR